MPSATRLAFTGVDQDVIVRNRRTVERETAIRLADFVAGTPGVPAVTPVVRSGPAARATARHALVRHCDLVVAGKRGAFELDEVLLGSVTLRLLEQRDRDLLLAPPESG